MIRLAKQYGRYGYRKIAQLLRLEGWVVNHKKIKWLWREEGLQVQHRHKKRTRLYHKDISVIRLRHQYPRHIRKGDFVHDQLSKGHSYKMLTVIDGYTRRHCMAAKPKIGHTEALDALYALFLKHRKPHYIRFDNGSEFFAHDLAAWLKKVGIKPIQIYLENPWKNGYNEHFNVILRR
jgi:putative transposase